MNTYTLNNIDKRSFGIIPGQHDSSDLAISGAWDMPSRIGKCFHDWGNSIEPYVLAEEIRFGGRDILFKGLVKADNRLDALNKLFGFCKFIDTFTDVVPLKSEEFGSWNVFVNGRIAVEYLGDGWCTIAIPYREPIVDLSGNLPTNKPIFKTVDVGGMLLDWQGNPIEVGEINFDGHGIDGVAFRDLGLIILSTDGDFDRPAMTEGEAIAYSHEPYQITRTGLREINIRALIYQPDYASFKSVLKGLYTLFKKPGLRFITKKKDALRDFFVKDGFQVTDVRAYDSQVSAILNIKLMEVAAHLEWNTLSDSAENGITTKQFGNIIITK